MRGRSLRRNSNRWSRSSGKMLLIHFGSLFLRQELPSILTSKRNQFCNNVKNMTNKKNLSIFSLLESDFLSVFVDFIYAHRGLERNLSEVPIFGTLAFDSLICQ